MQNLDDFKVLLRYLADLVDESIISEWQAGCIIGAVAMKDSIALFDFSLYERSDENGKKI